MQEQESSFEVGVGLHQGSSLSPLLFSIIMDVIEENIVSTLPELYCLLMI